MFTNVHVCFLVSIETHASCRLGGHGSQDRLCKTKIPRPYELVETGVGYCEYCNVGTTEFYLVGEINEMNRKNTNYY